MQDSLKSILLQKIRNILIPDFTNKLTWLLGSGGVALIVGPGIFSMAAEISINYFDVPLKVEFLAVDRSSYGIALCILAVLQNIAYQAKGVFSEISAIRESDRLHELDVLSRQHSHEFEVRDLESETSLHVSRRQSDIQKVAELLEIFPFEQSINTLVCAAECGISEVFQERLERLSGMHLVSNKFYDEDAESARRKLVEAAIEAQAKLSSGLIDDPRFKDRYVPMFEMKHDGRRGIYYETQAKMRESCFELIRSYQHLVNVLQQKTLWGVSA